MRHTMSGLLFGVGLFLVLSAAGSTVAATLHRPLPADSLERNGAPQPMLSHQFRFTPPPALPGGGLHPDAQAGLKRLYTGTPIDVLTFHYDNLRTGWNQSETDLTPASVASAAFGQLTTLNVDGRVLAQPLLVSQFVMADGSKHDVLIVVTEHNSVYAFDAQTYAVLWQVNLGPSQSNTDVGCKDFVPEFGISSTPVITRAGPGAATLYVVSATEPAAFSFHTQVHALDLTSGADLTAPVEINPSAPLSGGGTIGFDPQNQWNRAGLAYANGSLYVGLGSHCDRDAAATSGWVLDYDAGLTLRNAFNTIEVAAGYELASVWMSGFAPAIDAKGHVFVVTGNGAFSGLPSPRNYGESVVALSGDLTKVMSSFTPAAFKVLNSGDKDFGSGGVMLLPTVAGQTVPPLAVAMGKDPELYLLNQAKLGGKHADDSGALQAQRLAATGGLWGGPAYYGAAGTGLVYVQRFQDVLRAFSVAVTGSPALTEAAAGTSLSGAGGSMPIVSSNGAVAGTGVVWLIRRGATEQLEAYDAVNLGAPLFQANAGDWANNGRSNAFLTPMEANGRVYVPGYQTVTVFGLTR
jgi:hypothetical protein